MITLQYPAAAPPTRKRGLVHELFDPVRKKWVQLQPEEWVRQQFLQLLIQTHHYPVSLMAVEQSISLGVLKKRFDILVYDRHQQPWMMVECKAESVLLTETVLDQLLRYNMSVPARYLMITNGIHCLGWEREKNGLTALEKIPVFPV